MTDFSTAHAGIAVCRRLVNDMPDAPIYVKDVEGWFATPATDPERPYVRLEATTTNIAVSVRPRMGVFADDIGLTEWAEYPQPTVEAVQSEAFYEALRTTVKGKLAEIRATA